MTRWLDFLFNIWPSTTVKNCPKALKICQRRFTNFPNTKTIHTDLPETLILLPKWRNFAKSGHTGFSSLGLSSLQNLYVRELNQRLVLTN